MRFVYLCVFACMHVCVPCGAAGAMNYQKIDTIGVGTDPRELMGVLGETACCRLTARAEGTLCVDRPFEPLLLEVWSPCWL